MRDLLIHIITRSPHQCLEKSHESALDLTWFVYTWDCAVHATGISETI